MTHNRQIKRQASGVNFFFILFGHLFEPDLATEARKCLSETLKILIHIVLFSLFFPADSFGFPIPAGNLADFEPMYLLIGSKYRGNGA